MQDKCKCVKAEYNIRQGPEDDIVLSGHMLREEWGSLKCAIIPASQETGNPQQLEPVWAKQANLFTQLQEVSGNPIEFWIKVRYNSDILLLIVT